MALSLALLAAPRSAVEGCPRRRASPRPPCASASPAGDAADEREAHALFEHITKTAEAVFVEDDAAALSALPTESAPLPIFSELALDKLIKVGDALTRAKQLVEEAPPRNAPPDTNMHVSSFGQRFAEVLAHVFGPTPCEDDIFKGAGLSGWSGDVRTKKRLTQRLDVLHAWQRNALSQRK